MWHGFYLLAVFLLVQGRNGYLLPPRLSAKVTPIDSRTFSFAAAPNDIPQADDASTLTSCTTSDPSRSVSFSVVMTLCGAMLGPFLDAYHSAFGVLQYEEPITATLWGTKEQPALITAWWVPELFGLAGFIIGWLYILLDSRTVDRPSPSPPLILAGISVFTFQYWLSGIMFSAGMDRSVILGVMSAIASVGFFAFDGTATGLITSLATALCGPLIELGLLSTLHGRGGYQYVDGGETGFFPLWIVPVYFLGGPAVGNPARGFWNLLSRDEQTTSESSPCPVCYDSRAVPCPNCDDQGYYATYGTRVQCPACKGRGFVICRACFDRYDEDPNDIEAIRELMTRMPD